MRTSTYMTFASAVAAVHTASAFVVPNAGSLAVNPGSRTGTKVALRMANLENVVGGKGFGRDSEPFDPLGFANKASPLELKKYQESEIKHGRVAMLAVVGYLVQEQFHPFFTSTPDQDIGPALTHVQFVSSVAPRFWIAALLAIGVFESTQISLGWQKQNPLTEGIADLKEDYVAGNLNFDPLNLAPVDSGDNFVEMRRKELNNGRLAMIAIIGFWAQELVDGKPILGSTHLPF